MGLSAPAAIRIPIFTRRPADRGRGLLRPGRRGTVQGAMPRNAAHLLVLLVPVLAACGGASYPQVPYEERESEADERAPAYAAESGSADAAPAPVVASSRAESRSGSWSLFGSSESKRATAPAPRTQGAKAYGGSNPDGGSGPQQGRPAGYLQEQIQEQGDKSGKLQAKQGPRAGPLLNEPMVVYLGWLRLRVKRVIEAVDAITALAQSRGGYVQSMTPQAIVVRVPGADFDAAMTAFAAVGEVVDRRVKALDVTKQFTDLAARLQVAVDARDRLLALLKTVQNVEERLQILDEVKRLSEQIETAESTLATLRNLAHFYTITIELEPLVANYGAAAVHRSPFAWIRGLSPHAVTLEHGKGDIQLAVPKGFVLFEKDDVWRAQAADTSMLRVGRVRNEPRGDATFWVDAVQFELDGRDEEKVDEGNAGAVRFRIWRNKELQPRYWLVGALAVGDQLYVVEAFLPNEAAWQAHRDGIKAALATLQGK